MPRQPRLEVPGTLYHVISRGNARQKFFLAPRDFQRYLSYKVWRFVIGHLLGRLSPFRVSKKRGLPQTPFRVAFRAQTDMSAPTAHSTKTPF